MVDLIKRTLSGRYEILEQLGQGGMATLYRAHHIQLDRYVAVKIMHDTLARDGAFAARFMREARLVAQLHHPHIIQVFDFDSIEDEHLYYIVVELIEGPSLARHLAAYRKRSERLPLDDMLHIIRDLAGALSYAHSRSMIHRDVKPGNVLLDGERTVLTDFGVAKMVTADVLGQFTVTGGMVGTPNYIPPEQALGRTGDARSDLYSLGVMMYQMATGELPFSSDTPVGMVMQHIHEEVRSPRSKNPNLPASLEYVILRLMAKDPARRYQTANALLADLNKLDTVEPFSVSDASHTPEQAVVIFDPQLAQMSGNADQLQMMQTRVLPPQAKARRLRTGLFAVMILALLGGAFFAGRTLMGSAQSPQASATANSQVALFGPTNTPSRTTTLTYTPTPTLEVALCTAQVSGATAVALRTRPDAKAPIVGVRLDVGERAAVVAVLRSALAVWWQLSVDSQDGWATGDDLNVSGKCGDVPVLTNTPTATRRALRTVATTARNATQASSTGGSGNTGNQGNNPGAGSGNTGVTAAPQPTSAPIIPPIIPTAASGLGLNLP